MNTLTRRQREFQTREQLFLNTARTLLRSEGAANLTMERIAELTEYAKGTVYKHFTCKEDILCALCLESLHKMGELFEHAQKIDTHSRVRVMAIGTAYQLFTMQFPEELDLLIATRTDNIRQKASHLRVEQLNLVDKTVHNLLRSVVNDAIQEGMLKLPAHIQTDEVCFSLWATSFGIMVLDQAKEVVSELNLPPVQQIVLNQLTLLLDGYGWKPLSTEYDYLAAYQHILQHMEAQP